MRDIDNSSYYWLDDDRIWITKDEFLEKNKEI